MIFHADAHATRNVDDHNPATARQPTTTPAAA